MGWGHPNSRRKATASLILDRSENSDATNVQIVTELQESGIAAPSTTILEGRVAIRAAIVNHRTQRCDLDALIAAVLKSGSGRALDREARCSAGAMRTDYNGLRSQGSAL